MADSALSTSLAAIVTALNADLGVNDLSGTGAVRRGGYDDPPRFPFAAVGTPDVKSEQGPTMHEYSRRVSLDVVVWAAGASLDLDARVIATEALADELLVALEAARATTANALYNAHEFAVEALNLPGAPGDPLIVVLTVAFAFLRTSGVG